MKLAIVRREPKVALSMDVYADNLISGLKTIHPDWEIIEVAPQPWSKDLENLWHTGNPLKKYAERFYHHPRAVNKIDADIFHIIDHTNAHVAYGLKKLGKPVVVTCHDLVQYVYPEILKNQSRFPALSMAMWQYSVKGIKAADGAIAISSNTAKDVTKWLKVNSQKIAVVPNGVNANFKVLEPQITADWKQKHQQSSAEICLLNVGSNHQRKNIDTVLQVLKAIAEQDIPVRLWSVGDGFTPQQQQFITAHNLESKITLFTQANQQELIQFYNAADILLAPSLYEGFGLTILEAMGCGTPVITANVSSLPEVAGDAAILVEPLDINAMVNAIKKIHSNAAYRQNLIDRGLDRVKEFSWQKTAAQAASFYQKIVAEKRKVMSDLYLEQINVF
ncbi:MAG: glycosyltransferase family 1 protein [Cyanobacteria bacterium P01_C01_bin.72]